MENLSAQERSSLQDLEEKLHVVEIFLEGPDPKSSKETEIRNACSLTLFCLDLCTLCTSQVESDWVFWNSYKACACFASTTECPGNPEYPQR